ACVPSCSLVAESFAVTHGSILISSFRVVHLHETQLHRPLRFYTTTLTPPGNWSSGLLIAIGRGVAMVKEAPSENKILKQRSTLLLAELVGLVGRATFLCSTPA